ncbi:hypothetical protein B0H11DRAFT_2270494 [Mycena galericulata]|nr:hypothetical protein B0H11DRAFT_2270494 [Mycena galericulata]
MPIPATASHETMNQYIYGGTGGHGGQGGQHGGHGGKGEGSTVHNNFQAGNLTVYTHGGGTPYQDFIEKKLANHVATKYEHTDQSKTFCAPDTRVEIQADIGRWLFSEQSTARILWIMGIAGSGKSTLSATLVDTLRKNHTPVAAQFFISRNIRETTDPDKIIPTIGKQLSEFSSDAAQIIHDTLKKNGFPSSREEQVQALLLAPIRELAKSRSAVIILIDALDELQNAAESVLEILSPIAGSDLPDNVRFIVTSRPEHWANIYGSEALDVAVFKQHTLDTDLSVEEVNKFIVAKMREITPTKPGWGGWPTDDQLKTLSEKANGLFHYATTALQWIKEQIHKRGKACRKEVFKKFAQLGIGQLEDLYRLILTSFENIDDPAQDACARAKQLRGFQHVIGTILVLYETLTIRQIISLLADIPEDDFDVANFLQQFRSVLIPGMTASFEDATPQMHKSFRDYIMNAAPTQFRILTDDAHFMTARSCLEVVVATESQLDIHWQYSVDHWHQHLRQAMEEGATCEGERMWNLFGQMVEKAVVDVWGQNLFGVFTDVATAGWWVLKVVCAFPWSPLFDLLTLPRLLVSSRCLVCAFPHSPLLILLTLPCLLICRDWCVLFLGLSCSSHSLHLTFSSQASGVCFSSATPAHPAHFASTSLISRDGCMLFLSPHCSSRSLCLPFSTLASSVWCVPFPWSLMLISLTAPHLLVSSQLCVLFLSPPFSPCSLCLSFSSLGVGAYFSPVTRARLTYFASPSCL